MSKSEGDDIEFARRHAQGIPASQFVSVSGDQLHPAEKTKGWQAYSILYPTGNPAEVAHSPVFASKNFRSWDPKHGRFTGDAFDPLSAALIAAGADRVDAGEFRTLGENASLLRPLAGMDFQVWASPERQARDGKQCHDRFVRGRMPRAPTLSGSLTWIPFPRVSVRRAFAKSWKYFEARTGGLSAERDDGCPTGLFGRGVPVGRTVVRPM